MPLENQEGSATPLNDDAEYRKAVEEVHGNTYSRLPETVKEEPSQAPAAVPEKPAETAAPTSTPPAAPNWEEEAKKGEKRYGDLRTVADQRDAENRKLREEMGEYRLKLLELEQASLRPQQKPQEVPAETGRADAQTAKKDPWANASKEAKQWAQEFPASAEMVKILLQEALESSGGNQNYSEQLKELKSQLAQVSSITTAAKEQAEASMYQQTMQEEVGENWVKVFDSNQQFADWINAPKQRVYQSLLWDKGRDTDAQAHALVAQAFLQAHPEFVSVVRPQKATAAVGGSGNVPPVVSSKSPALKQVQERSAATLAPSTPSNVLPFQKKEEDMNDEELYDKIVAEVHGKKYVRR